MVRWTLEWLERELHSELYGLKHELHAALLEYALEQKTFDLHWDQLQELEARIQQHKLPWLKIERGPSRAELTNLAGQWKQVFGDPNDPAVAERIRATVEALRGRVEQAT